jgi:hypothetical protein
VPLCELYQVSSFDDPSVIHHVFMKEAKDGTIRKTLLAMIPKPLQVRTRTAGIERTSISSGISKSRNSSLFTKAIHVANNKVRSFLVYTVCAYVDDLLTKRPDMNTGWMGGYPPPQDEKMAEGDKT